VQHTLAVTFKLLCWQPFRVKENPAHTHSFGHGIVNATYATETLEELSSRREMYMLVHTHVIEFWTTHGCPVQPARGSQQCIQNKYEVTNK